MNAREAARLALRSATASGVLTTLPLLLVVGWPLGVLDAMSAEPFMGLALALAATAALMPAAEGGGRTTAPILAAACAFASLGALALLQPALQVRIVRPDAAMLALAAASLAAVAAATWRSMGPALPLALTALASFVLFVGPLLPDRFATLAVEPARVAAYLAFDANGLLSRMLYIAAADIAPFVLFGGLFVATGSGRALTAPLGRLLRDCHGGAQKTAVLGSTVFGMVSGSAVANVATSGPVTIPMMIEDGTPAHEAAAIEAVASTNGQLMPPVMGASAFLMAEWLGLPYATVALAAAAPAALTIVALVMQIDFRARARASAGVSRPRARVDAGTVDIPGLLLALGPFAVLAHALLVAGAPPGLAALTGSAALAALHLAMGGPSGFAKRLRTLAAGALDSARAIIGILLLAASAALIMGLLNVSGAGFMLTVRLLDLSGGAFAPVAAMTAGLALLLGLGMPTAGVYLVGASLCAPALVAAGAEPLAAHLYIASMGMLSMITPPVALASYAAAQIAQAGPWRTALAALRLAAAPAMVAVSILILPALLDPFAGMAFAEAVATSALALALLAAADAGHVSAPLAPAARVLALGLSLGVLAAAALDAGGSTSIAALLAGLTFLALHTATGQRALMGNLRQP